MYIVALLVVIPATSLSVVDGVTRIQDKPQPVEKLDRATVWQLLYWHERNPNRKFEDNPLLKFGEAAFDAYESILTASKSDRLDVTLTFGMLGLTRGVDRSRFLGITVDRLNDPNGSIRFAALQFLGEIGSERDTAPVIALLSDDDITVRHVAAKVLAKIGGKQDLVAIDIWLRVGNHCKDDKLIQRVKDAREDIAKRLKESPFPKGSKN